MAGENILGLENLGVWNKAKNLVLVVYQQVLQKLPADEKWSLNQQLRRAVQSVPANIAEGHGRFYYQENIHFCYIARGSLIETYSHLFVAHDLKYISDEMFYDLKGRVEELARMLNGYIAYLKHSKRGENEPGAASMVRELPPEYFAEVPTPIQES
ncbi:MAG: four helix bundle protein [Chloroflexota bacterium]